MTLNRNHMTSELQRICVMTSLYPLYYNCQLRIVCLLNTVKNYSADVLGVSPSTFAPTPILLFFSPFMTSFYQCPSPPPPASHFSHLLSLCVILNTKKPTAMRIPRTAKHEKAMNNFMETPTSFSTTSIRSTGGDPPDDKTNQSAVFSQKHSGRDFKYPHQSASYCIVFQTS